MPNALIVTAVYMFIPMLIAIITQKLIYRESLKSLGLSWKLNKWFLVAWLLPLIIVFATLAISLLFPGVEYSPTMSEELERIKSIVTPEELKQIQSDLAAVPSYVLILTRILQGLIAGVTINAVFGFGEELGWRGLLQTELNFMGFWKSSAIIGLTWGVWHAPLILQGHNYPQHPQIGVLMMTILTLLLSPIYSYIRIKSKSVIAAAIMHGTTNALAVLPISLIKGGNDLTVGITGLAGLIAIAIVIIGLFAYDYFLAKEPVMSK
ncbi:CPBP family intramembrane glutamic endopeptidase [Nostoc sp. MG11]|uniref:CPBP family intramembrane glutamic endopeptidase n=1 Tax=Nostoc sp. MG11 TaxID=2721166 RepID=UPI001D0233E9|nr:CPBP family intramembrane glutamic endopeptidase [Nostoc sp. MG11]